jgi:hypothetical protein
MCNISTVLGSITTDDLKYTGEITSRIAKVKKNSTERRLFSQTSCVGTAF